MNNLKLWKDFIFKFEGNGTYDVLYLQTWTTFLRLHEWVNSLDEEPDNLEWLASLPLYKCPSCNRESVFKDGCPDCEEV